MNNSLLKDTMINSNFGVFKIDYFVQGLKKIYFLTSREGAIIFFDKALAKAKKYNLNTELILKLEILIHRLDYKYLHE